MELKEMGKYSLYLLPGYGLYKQFKRPKEERNLVGMIGFGLYSIPFFLKVALIPAYVNKVVTTGNWNPFDLKKTEKVEKVKDNCLENKTMQADEFLQNFNSK